VLSLIYTFQFTAAHTLGFSVSTSRLLATDLNTETITSNNILNPHRPTSCGLLYSWFQFTPFACFCRYYHSLSWTSLSLSLLLSLSESQSQSYVTTDGQSASLSWNKGPIWGLWPDLYFRMTVAGLLKWGTLSDERMGLSFASQSQQ
jgi:hypothetical protein